MEPCFVTAVLTAKPGMAQQLEQEVVRNIPVVRAENGCLRYDFHKNDAENTFLFYEIWENSAALAAHAKAPHMLAYKERTRDLLARPTVVNVWSEVDRQD